MTHGNSVAKKRKFCTWMRQGLGPWSSKKRPKSDLFRAKSKIFCPRGQGQYSRTPSVYASLFYF